MVLYPELSFQYLIKEFIKMVLAGNDGIITYSVISIPVLQLFLLSLLVLKVLFCPKTIKIHEINKELYII